MGCPHLLHPGGRIKSGEQRLRGHLPKLADAGLDRRLHRDRDASHQHHVPDAVGDQCPKGKCETPEEVLTRNKLGNMGPSSSQDRL